MAESAMAIDSGVLREPGETQACVTPAASSPATNPRVNSVFGSITIGRRYSAADTIPAVIAIEAYDLGQEVGRWLAAPLVAFALVAGWGALRSDAQRLRAGVRYAWHRRTVPVIGLLWGLTLIGAA
jgi:hypothetical protein